MQNDQSRAITAVLISGVILFAWQFFFAPQKSPETKNAITQTQVDTKKQTDSLVTETSSTNQETDSEVSTGKAITISKGEFTYTLDDSFTFRDATYNGVSAADKVFETKSLLKFTVMGEQGALPGGFSLTKTSEDSFEISNNSIEAKGKILDNGKIAIQAKKKNNSTAISLKMRLQSIPGENDNYQVRSFAYLANDLETITVGSQDKETATVNWIGMDYLFHLFAVTLKEKAPVNISTSEADNSLTSYLSLNEEGKLDFNVIFIKKNYDLLKKMGENLHLSVNFGIFSFIAVPILRGLQFFYSLVLNYGIAIIFLTFVIRLLTFPLQYKSTKSMKKMQVIQPELKKIQEKFKDNPQRLQKESMELFKRAGANPLSGCFPLLLQMPIFFAFYKVLYNAVELVNAPFYFWITDLSQKDPYYVLPVLMTGAMFLQQKLTPTATTDPAQQKVMMIMPIVFGFIMKDLPSGLNLYIFVSTLIAIVMQMLVLKKVKA